MKLPMMHHILIVLSLALLAMTDGVTATPFGTLSYLRGIDESTDYNDNRMVPKNVDLLGAAGNQASGTRRLPGSLFNEDKDTTTSEEKDGTSKDATSMDATTEDKDATTEDKDATSVEKTSEKKDRTSMVRTSEDKDATTEDKDATSEDKDATSEDKDATTEDKDATSEDKDATTEDKDATTEDKDATTEDKDATTEDKDATTEDKDATTEDAAVQGGVDVLTTVSTPNGLLKQLIVQGELGVKVRDSD
jgi:hypothetical protein